MRVFVDPYGCTLNQGEAYMIGELARSMGHEVVEREEEADVVVLGTCVVIERTERDMWKRITRLAESGKKLVVSGCLPQVFGEKLASIAPEVFVVPPGNMDLAADFFSSEKPDNGVSLRPGVVGVVGYVPIATGCLGNCAYCITHLARGRLRSYPPCDVVRWVVDAVRRGAREVRLSAQDTGVYGFDIGTDLPSLLREIGGVREKIGGGVPGDFMLRVGMMNPLGLKRISAGLVDVIGGGGVFRFLHLPVQSGSDRVLSAMRRGYSVEEYVWLVEDLRDRLGSFTLATDIILGFPGEKKEDFMESMRLLDRLRPDVVNITRFSPRPGTLAVELARKNPPPPGWVVKEWSRAMTEKRFSISTEINRRFVGKELRALVVERERRGGGVVARTEDYRAVVVKHPRKKSLGRWIRVKITGAGHVYLKGEEVGGDGGGETGLSPD